MSEQRTHTPGDWDWQKFGAHYHLVAQHGKRPCVLTATSSDVETLCPLCEEPISMHVAAHLSTRYDHIGRGGVLGELTPDHPDAKLIRAAPNLARASVAAWRLIQSLLIVRDGATDELLTEVGGALTAALLRAGIEPTAFPPEAKHAEP